VAFVPFSKRSKEWEPRAQQLRKMVPWPDREAVAFDPWKLAPKVGLTVLECSFQGLDPEEQSYLLSHANGDWSGGVFAETLPDGSRVCMLNPTHPQRRNKITLMEEICHCFLGHTPTKLVAKDQGRVRDYEKAQEEEAFGIGAAVLLPWRLFFTRINSGRPVDELAEEFEVSQDLIRYRIKICGATHLYKLRRGADNV
jgi:hypothetical protein